jgi:hypothetical protein
VNLVHKAPYYFSKIHFNIILPPTSEIVILTYISVDYMTLTVFILHDDIPEIKCIHTEVGNRELVYEAQLMFRG